MKIREPNYQMLFDSAVCAKQQAYQEYKTIKNEYAEQLEKAYDKFINASIEVERYRLMCADMRGGNDGN